MKRKHLLLLVWPLAFVCLFVSKTSEWAAEYIFARGLRKAYVTVVSLVTRLIPISLGELVLIFIVPALIFLTIKLIIKAKKSAPHSFSCVLNSLLSFFIFVGFVFFVYVIACGASYNRYTFTTFSGLTVEKSSISELEGLCNKLAGEANELRAGLAKEDEEGAFDSSYTNSELADFAKDAYDKLADEYPVLDGIYPAPKKVIHSRFMSEFNITGVFFPWTAEANVNTDIADYSVPSTMCHELTHIRGFMREDEANYLAYRACLCSDEPELRYSGIMLALINAGNALYDADRDAYNKLWGTYSEGVATDLIKNSEYWKQFKETTLSEVGNKMNDTYLKLNDQEDGIKSYGRMVDLLLAEYRRSLYE